MESPWQRSGECYAIARKSSENLSLLEGRRDRPVRLFASQAKERRRRPGETGREHSAHAPLHSTHRDLKNSAGSSWTLPSRVPEYPCADTQASAPPSATAPSTPRSTTSKTCRTD